ncbi:MAG: PIN domain-containing protein [Trichloromonas sp.]|jgi:predicted nucleic acid-binding protein|nr:PIN domain-containing protein [Trichloromonas sp.]
MANPRLLPDTCAWIDFFRGDDSEPARLLEQGLRGSATVCVCGPILYELVQGVRSEKEETAILNALEGLVALEVTDTLWIGAGRISAQLKKQGITLPNSDILIAAVALANDLTVLTRDKHFLRIPQLATMGIPPEPAH